MSLAQTLMLRRLCIRVNIMQIQPVVNSLATLAPDTVHELSIVIASIVDTPTSLPLRVVRGFLSPGLTSLNDLFASGNMKTIKRFTIRADKLFVWFLADVNNKRYVLVFLFLIRENI